MIGLANEFDPLDNLGGLNNSIFLTTGPVSAISRKDICATGFQKERYIQRGITMKNNIVIEKNSAEDIQPPVIAKNEETGLTEIQIKPNQSKQFGTENKNILRRVFHQIDCLNQGRCVDEETEVLISNSMLAAVTEVKPGDTTELMLATQMIAVHELAMEMSRRALAPNQSLEATDQNVNRLTKLMRTYATQIEALNRYRSKGQQKITVQHVNVGNGGQAIVGDISQGGG